MSLHVPVSSPPREEVFPNFFSSSVQGSLCFKPTYSIQVHSTLSLLKDLERNFSNEFKLETGRLASCLAMFENGISKKDLAKILYPDFDTSSPRRQRCLETSLSKLLQRAKKKFKSFGLSIDYCHKTNKWSLYTNSLYIKAA